jgi:transposase-like protein
MAKGKDPLEQLLDQIDYSNLSQEILMGPNGLIEQLTKRILEKAMNAKMNERLGVYLNL